LGAGKLLFDQDGLMSQKRRFTPEPVTKPATRRPKAPPVRTSTPVPKSKRERAEAPTIPPPGRPKQERGTHVTSDANDVRHSGMRARRPSRSAPAATVDEVVADLSKDPRRDHDEDD
jgi:hypothetical protein